MFITNNNTSEKFTFKKKNFTKKSLKFNIKILKNFSYDFIMFYPLQFSTKRRNYKLNEKDTYVENTYVQKMKEFKTTKK